jgi:hypothetical protein
MVIGVILNLLMVLNKLLITGNVNQKSGGGLYVASSTNTTIIDCDFLNNNATTQDGGGAFFKLSNNEPTLIQRTDFVNNSAVKRYGGGLATGSISSPDQFVMIDVYFTDNYAKQGAAYFSFSKDNVPVENNVTFGANRVWSLASYSYNRTTNDVANLTLTFPYIINSWYSGDDVQLATLNAVDAFKQPFVRDEDNWIIIKLTLESLDPGLSGEIIGGDYVKIVMYAENPLYDLKIYGKPGKYNLTAWRMNTDLQPLFIAYTTPVEILECNSQRLFLQNVTGSSYDQCLECKHYPLSFTCIVYLSPV